MNDAGTPPRADATGEVHASPPPPPGESTPGAPPNTPRRSTGAGLAGGIIVAIAVLFVLALVPLLISVALFLFVFRRSSDAALGGMLDHAGLILTLL